MIIMDTIVLILSTEIVMIMTYGMIIHIMKICGEEEMTLHPIIGD